MKDLTIYLLNQIVEHPDKVTVTESITESGSVVLTIAVADTDMGRVIGKSGKVIRAIRDLVKIVAVKENKHVDVILAE